MPEFDKFAAKYDDLLRDPIRDRFAPGSAFFAERKATLIAAWMASRGIPTQDSSWLDVGCGQGELLMGARRSWGRVAGCDLSPEMLSSCDDLNVAVMTDP
jgi:ubiquinone/menaquinone biosynthesis C-methylase UbiE